jgi:WD40 repeat protein
VFACAYAPAGDFALSGGWDGQLCLWEAASGALVTAFTAGQKPVSACAVSPDGRYWLSGSMDGMLAHWDAQTQQRESIFLAHNRPISAMVFGSDGRTWATASWDGNLALWDRKREREGRTLTGHQDIVAGCRFSPEARMLLSWSYDGTLALWDVERAERQARLVGHTDRLTAGAYAPDGRWVVSGSRDRMVKLWDLHTGGEAASCTLKAEVRACLFLLDCELLAVVDAQGRLSLHGVPDLQERAELVTGLRVQCAEVAPTGSQIVMGCEDGAVRFVAIDGFDSQPLAVTAGQVSRRQATRMERLFGRSHVTRSYVCTCPVCRRTFELPNGAPGQTVPCAGCRRHLRIGTLTIVEEQN